MQTLPRSKDIADVAPLRGNQCECSVCLLRFGGVRAFDDHRVGRHGARRCLTVGELAELGMYVTPRGWSRHYNTISSRRLRATRHRAA
jgi:hypothetical protein